MQAVVVHTFEDAQNCLLYLQESKLGKAMLIWLEVGGGEEERMEVDEEQVQIAEDVLNRCIAEMPALKDRVVGFAWRCIQCDRRYLPLFRRMLQGCVLVEDVETARAIVGTRFIASPTIALAVSTSSTSTPPCNIRRKRCK